MTEELFEEARQRLMATGSPSDGLNLVGMSIDFDPYLGMTELFKSIEVRQNADPRCLLVATCVVNRGVTPTTVGEALVRIWQDELRYHHREAHRLRQDHFGVYLDVVTLSDDGGIYVTGLIRTTWDGAAIP